MDMNEYATGSEWLKADMLSEPIVSEIKDVYTAPSNFGGKQIVLECADFKYSMRIGHPNIQRLVDTLGSSSEDWVGCNVEFSTEEYTDKKSGELKLAIVAKGVSVVEGRSPKEVNEMFSKDAGKDADIPPPPTPNLDIDPELGF